ncbi:MAG: PD-(D/E)XK nuclease family protein [Alphaproteobacteria bacterium]|jgi:hypothetical protein
MARGVSYFQRYSQAENHATNNTMQALRYLYQSSPFKIEQLLNDLLDTDVSIGLSFELQPKGKKSVPDALMSQKAIHVFIETKLGATIDEDQIKRHLETIFDRTEKDSRKFLIALTKEPISEPARKRASVAAHEKGVNFAAITFSRLLEGLEAQCASYERDLRAILDDYRSYLSEEGLLDERNRWLVAFPCGTSFEENIRFGIYYESASKASKAAYPLIGIYRQKAVSHVGRVEAVAIVGIENKKYSFDVESGNLTGDHKKRIQNTFEQTLYYDLESEPRRFYLVDKFVATDFRKVSPNGLQGFRYLDLAKQVQGYDSKRNYSSEELASAIKGSTWS